MTGTVYLDHNATTPIRPAALDAMAEAARAVGNPSSVHAAGRAARGRLEHARRQVAALFGRPAEQVVFTSGGTEADVLALRGTERTRRLVSAVEHDAVLAAAYADTVRIPVDAEGRVDLAALERLLAADAAPALVAVMWVNNETGVIQPVDEVIRLAHAAGALVHVDAVQGAGRLDPAPLAGADLVALSAHKIGGPAGVGALLVRPGVALRPLAVGGGQERGRRSGTENLPGIAGFGAAAAAAAASGVAETAAATVLRDRLEAAVRAVAPEARVLGAGAERVATTCLGLPGVPAETQVMALDLAGVAVSAGAACSSGKVRRSHVLAAMLGDDPLAGQAIRVSLGWTTTEADIDRLIAAWTAMRGRLSPAARAA